MNSSYLDRIIQELSQSKILAHVSLVSQSGSAPRSAGAKMLVFSDGSQWGTVGGGRYEGEAVKASLELLREQKDKLFRNSDGKEKFRPAKKMYFSLADVKDMDMICGGNLLLLIELIDPSSLLTFEKAREAEKAQKSYTFISQLDFPIEQKRKGSWHSHGQSRRCLLAENTEIDKLGLPAELLKKIAENPESGEDSYLFQAEGEETRNWLVEDNYPRRSLYIFGGGHVSKALAKLADFLNFSCIIIDDRAEFISPERFPFGRSVLAPSLTEKDNDEYLSDANIIQKDAIIIITRGHAFDRDALASALKTKASYIGMIGSKNKRELLYKNLRESGVSDEKLARVHCPVGLTIGAETPEEIAVSIAAELISWLRGA